MCKQNIRSLSLLVNFEKQALVFVNSADKSGGKTRVYGGGAGGECVCEGRREGYK